MINLNGPLGGALSRGREAASRRRRVLPGHHELRLNLLPDVLVDVPSPLACNTQTTQRFNLRGSS